MFGIDSSELLLIAIVALVVIGPKELPGLLRTWGKWMAQMRGMASEFRGHVDEMIRQSELDAVRKQLTDATGGVDLANLDPTAQIRQHIEEGVAEGEKAISEAKSSLETSSLETSSPETASLESSGQETSGAEGASPPTAGLETPPADNALAEPESAPQIAAEAQSEAASAATEVAEATPSAAHVPAVEDKPAKAAAE
jgi:sec-independent protein translocase protein TatB